MQVLKSGPGHHRPALPALDDGSDREKRRYCGRNMRLFVTGAAGFIGSNFVRYWRQTHPGDFLLAFDAMTYAGCEANLAGQLDDRCVFEKGDIGDLDRVTALLTEHVIDVVVNFAAESHNSYAILNPTAFFATNVLGTQQLLEAARRTGVSRFHHISTCEVYGDLALDSPETFSETSPYQPRTPYNASKAGGDHAVRAYFETFGLPITISNCCNNYGPYQYPEKLIPLFSALALDHHPLPLYESSDNRREWIHVLDHCRAVDLILHDGQPGETYNVGTGIEASVVEITDAILATLDTRSEKTTVPDRPGHDRRYLLDSSKIRRELGWSPLEPFDAGLRDTILWYAANRDWWEPLRNRAPVVESGWE